MLVIKDSEGKIINRYAYTGFRHTVEVDTQREIILATIAIKIGEGSWNIKRVDVTTQELTSSPIQSDSYRQTIERFVYEIAKIKGIIPLEAGEE